MKDVDLHRFNFFFREVSAKEIDGNADTTTPCRELGALGSIHPNKKVLNVIIDLIRFFG